MFLFLSMTHHRAVKEFEEFPITELILHLRFEVILGRCGLGNNRTMAHRITCVTRLFWYAISKKCASVSCGGFTFFAGYKETALWSIISYFSLCIIVNNET